jgi:NTE family protein
MVRHHLAAFLGAVGDDALDLLLQRVQWVELAGGRTLMRQGDDADAMYVVVSGRLRAYQVDGSGQEALLREMGRGQIVGELALFTDAPRSATIVAVRDSVLVRLGKADFQALLSVSAPLTLAMTRQIVARMQAGSRPPTRPVSVALLPVTQGIDLPAFAQALGQQLRSHGSVCIASAEAVDRSLGRPGIARAAPDDDESGRRVALHLDELESRHDFLLLLADDEPGGWTWRCMRLSDERLLLADATRPPVLHPVEQALGGSRDGVDERAEATETLVLLHPASTAMPAGTARWLGRRPVDHHLHLRTGHGPDLARLARVLAGAAVGLVLAGGGARGLAHLGVLRALQEHGVEVDFVGGTSIGAVMASLAASDRPLAEVMPIARREFMRNPTGDFNWLPLVSLIAGRRLRRVVDAGFSELVGADAQVEDLWKGFFCVASNFTQARQELLQRGPLARALRASVAIPGALPPVPVDGDLLCDGGTFNNFPVDLMRSRRGVGRVIGVDLNVRRPRRVDLAEVPGTLALLRDRLRPYRERRYRLPSLASYLMNATVLYSLSRHEEARRQTDLYFNPPLERVGMLQWHRFDDIVEQGYRHACEVLAAGRAVIGPA